VGGNRGLPAAMRERASLQHTGKAIPPQPLQITPETLRGEACRVALLEEGAVALQDGAEGLITGSGVPIGRRFTGQESKLRRDRGHCRHRVLPPAEYDGCVEGGRRYAKDVAQTSPQTSLAHVRRLNCSNPYKGSGHFRAKIYAKALHILLQGDRSKTRRVFHTELM
jgi:hypothetical protein